MHLNARKFLVPQCLRTFCNGLLRFTRNDGLFTTHHSRLTKAAFTLAETLIVIGIIGVVAALTLPNLNHATGDKETVTRVKKIYSSLTEALDRSQVIYGDFDTWFTGVTDVAQRNEIFAKRITEFLKVSKDCGTGEGCFSTAPLLDTDGSQALANFYSFLAGNSDQTVMLPDGISIAFQNLNNTTNTKAYIYVDVDGPNRGKNRCGADIFTFTIYIGETLANTEGVKINQLIPNGTPGNWTGDYDLGKNIETAWAIQNGNLDYLKCPDELNWETQTSCR